tara:strand:- start:10 stop:762 length:753 start_codon:yes stop_codon:yes gene_type:complete
MKPSKIPAELAEEPMPEIFLYMRRRGFSISAHTRQSANLKAEDAPSTWNLSDAEMAEYIGVAPNTMRKILANDPSVKWKTIEKVASFFLKELEPGSPLRYDWLHLVENRWNALQTKETVDQNQVSKSGSGTRKINSFNQSSIPPRSHINSTFWMTSAFAVTLAVIGGFYFDLHKKLLQVTEPEKSQSGSVVIAQETFFGSGVQPYTQEQRSQKIDMVLASALDSFKDQSGGTTRLVLSNMIQELRGGPRF